MTSSLPGASDVPKSCGSAPVERLQPRPPASVVGGRPPGSGRPGQARGTRGSTAPRELGPPRRSAIASERLSPAPCVSEGTALPSRSSLAFLWYGRGRPPGPLPMANGRPLRHAKASLIAPCILRNKSDPRIAQPSCRKRRHRRPGQAQATSEASRAGSPVRFLGCSSRWFFNLTNSR